MGRTAIFIDAGYLDVQIRQRTPRIRVDYAKLAQCMAGGEPFLRAYYYHCMPYVSTPPTAEEQGRLARKQDFVRYLSRLDRFQLRQGKLALRNGTFEQKRVDIMIAVDLVRLAWQRSIQTAALLTGDSDFVPAIEAAKDAGVLVQLFYSPTSVHDELLQHCDERHPMNDAFWNTVASV